MTQKTDTVPSAAKGFRLIGKLYRWVGWIGVAITTFLACYGFISQWNYMASYTGSYYGDAMSRFASPFLTALAVLGCGLTLCALAFLVSAIVDTCVNVTENNRARTELLRRIVREQSDVQ